MSSLSPIKVSAGLSRAWRLLGGLAPPRLDGAALRAWSDPGWIKVAMEFRLEPAPAGTPLSTETRILATDPSSRRFFAAYWFLIRASSAAIRRDVRSWCHPWSNVIRRSKRSGECRLVPGPAFPNARLRTDPGNPLTAAGGLRPTSYLQELNRLMVTH
jgi:hypothetical protein